MALRIIFMGTPDYAAPTLSALVEAGHEVVAVYCQPPRPGGRGMAERKSPVHLAAEKIGIPVLTPTSLKNVDIQSEFAAHHADLAVVVAYGLLLPQPILNAPRLGCINAHGSLLPRWRGAAPIQRAIEAGDSESGVSIMRMDAGLDTGPVMMSKSVAITKNMTAGELHDALAAISADLMVNAVADLEAGKTRFTSQASDGVTYAHKLTKSETRIDWKNPAAQVHNHVRAMSPFPGAWCEMGLGNKQIRVKILKSEMIDKDGIPGEVLDGQLTIGCERGAICPVELQKAGKHPVRLSEFLRGNLVAIGTVID